MIHMKFQALFSLKLEKPNNKQKKNTKSSAVAVISA